MCQCATIDDYFDFYNFVKLRDGRIAIQLMMGSDGADYVFDPYTEEVADGDGKVKAKDIDNSLYHSHMLYLGEIENKMPLPTKQVYESNASTNTKDQTIDILNFADNYLGKTVNSSNHALMEIYGDTYDEDYIIISIPVLR